MALTPGQRVKAEAVYSAAMVLNAATTSILRLARKVLEEGDDAELALTQAQVDSIIALYGARRTAAVAAANALPAS